MKLAVLRQGYGAADKITRAYYRHERLALLAPDFRLGRPIPQTKYKGRDDVCRCMPGQAIWATHIHSGGRIGARI